MPINFTCDACRKEIRVPDGTEGKKTKCPFCQAVQSIPLSSGEPKLGDPQTVPPTSPFGSVDMTDPDNPFASPGSSGSRPIAATGRILPLGELRQRLLIPTIVQFVFVCLGMMVALGYSVMGIVMMVLDNQPGMVFMAVFYGVAALLHIPALIGLVAAWRQSSFVWAWVGFIMSVLPPSSCCSCLGVPIGVGIWGMIVLADPQTRQLFSK